MDLFKKTYSSNGWRIELPAGIYYTKKDEQWCINISWKRLTKWLQLDTQRHICLYKNKYLNSSNNDFDIYNFIPTINDDPNLLGRIAATALLSKLFLNERIECQQLCFIIGIIPKFGQEEKEIIYQSALKGFQQTAEKINIKVEGSIIFESSQCMFGGVISSTHSDPENPYKFSNNSIAGDVLILTKPLGTQLAIKAFQLLKEKDNEQRKILLYYLTENMIQKTYNDAIESMTQLNCCASQLLFKYDVRALTEINGKNYIEHLQELAKEQVNQVSFFINNFPVFENTWLIVEALSQHENLLKGNLTEYSGGLLIIMPMEQAVDYCRNLNNNFVYASIVGKVGKGNRKAEILKNLKVIECRKYNKKNKN